jgi:hypothetical protein
MGGIFLELFKEFLSWRAHNIMNFVYLIEFIIAGEKRVEWQNFEKNTSNAPNVHFVTVKSISHQTLWCSIPSGWNVFSQRRFAVETSTTTQIRQLYCISRKQNIFSKSLGVRAFKIWFRLTVLYPCEKCHSDACVQLLWATDRYKILPVAQASSWSSLLWLHTSSSPLVQRLMLTCLWVHHLSKMWA